MNQPSIKPKNKLPPPETSQKADPSPKKQNKVISIDGSGDH